MTVYKDLQTFINQNKSKEVIFCVANNGVNEMTFNLIESCRINKINIVVFALDKSISKFLENACDVVNYFVELGGNQIYEYETENFKKIAYYRFFILGELLRDNRKIIYLDIDIFVNKNFINDISYELNKYDVVIQTNGKNCCTGFFAIRPTDETKKYFTKSNFESKNYLNYLDQDFFNQEIFDKNIFKLKLLRIDLYPNGAYYYKNYKKIDNSCYIIHFNNIVGYIEKIKKMNEHKKWIIS